MVNRRQSNIIFSIKGLTLVEVSIVLVILGLLIGLGASLMGPLTKRAKINETKETLNANFEAIISWAAGNKKLPDSSEFVSVVRSQNDSWGKSFYYFVAQELVPTQSSSGTEHSICDRRTTNLSVCWNGDCTSPNRRDNIAFFLASSGENYNLNSSQTTGNCPSDKTCYSLYDMDYCLDPPRCNVKFDDLVKWITLDELRIKVGCQGPQLRILNNELPFGFVNSSYNAVIYAEGGVPFSKSEFRYKWCLKESPPRDLNLKPSINFPSKCDESDFEYGDNLVILGVPYEQGTYNLTFFVKDSDGNMASKSLVLTIHPQSKSNLNNQPPESTSDVARDTADMFTTTPTPRKK